MTKNENDSEKKPFQQKIDFLGIGEFGAPILAPLSSRRFREVISAELGSSQLCQGGNPAKTCEAIFEPKPTPAHSGEWEGALGWLGRVIWGRDGGGNPSRTDAGGVMAALKKGVFFN